MRHTRRALALRVRELESRLGAAAGETRKNMRDRLAKTTGELAEAKKQIDQLTRDVSERDKKLQEVLTERANQKPAEEPRAANG